MHRFFVRWRSARPFREYELFADAPVGARLYAALESSGGLRVWQSGTLWKCPGCGDRTVRTEEFLEGLRQAQEWLHLEEAGHRREGGEPPADLRAALDWLETAQVRMLGCERDRVYIKDEATPCRFEGETYISRV